jgi:hypothetical protein
MAPAQIIMQPVKFSGSERQMTKRIVPRIRWGRLSSLDIYEVTKEELDALEQGAPCSLFLNLAIAFASTGVSFFTALVTGTISSGVLFDIFVIIVAVSLAAGTVMTLLWWRSQTSLKELTQKIRRRLPDADGKARSSTKERWG